MSDADECPTGGNQDCVCWPGQAGRVRSCRFCSQPVNHDGIGWVHEGGWLMCQDQNNRAAPSETGRTPSSDGGVTPAAERQVWFCSYCEAWQIDVPVDVASAEVERLLAGHIAECPDA